LVYYFAEVTENADMIIRCLTIDHWAERGDHPQSIQNPAWNQVEEAICSLDGKARTIATLAISDDAYMLVSGRWNDLYMVNATPDSRQFFSLVDPARDKKKVVLFVGGQNGDFEANKLTSLRTVFEAAEYYYATGKIKETMNWVNDYS
jgi:hypothetical protein